MRRQSFTRRGGRPPRETCQHPDLRLQPPGLGGDTFRPCKPPSGGLGYGGPNKLIYALSRQEIEAQKVAPGLSPSRERPAQPVCLTPPAPTPPLHPPAHNLPRTQNLPDYAWYTQDPLRDRAGSTLSPSTAPAGGAGGAQRKSRGGGRSQADGKQHGGLRDACVREDSRPGSCLLAEGAASCALGPQGTA